MNNLFTNKSFSAPQNDVTPRTVIATQSNTFNAVFDPKPLDEAEQRSIEKLLVESYRPGTIEEKKVEEDVQTLKNLTAEIKAIGRQGIVLMGERVSKAREMLKPYKDGTFTKWLDTTFGTRKTGYNALSYFELYRKLHNLEIKEKFKKIPLRAAYVLASREGSLSVKEEIIRKYHKLGHIDLVTIIQEQLLIPKEKTRDKKGFTERLIIQMGDTLKKLEKRKDVLTETNRMALEEMRDTLSSMLS